MSTLHFPKLSRFDRAAEPVTVSIPFREGALPEPHHLWVRDGDSSLPCQTRALGRWPDGSVRWALVHMQVDLPGNRSHTLAFGVDPALAPPAAPHHGHGVLSFAIPEGQPLSLKDLTVHGRPFPLPLDNLFRLRLQDGPALQPVVERVEEVESGPLRWILRLFGRHTGPGADLQPAFHGQVTVHRGKPWLELEHQFIHDGDAPETQLASLSLDIAPAMPPDRAAVALGEGYYTTRIEQSDACVEMEIDAETLLYQSNEHFSESFYGDFWVDWRTDGCGLAVSHYQAHQHYPKGLRAAAEGIRADLYPAAAEPARILQGMGKTHRLLLQFHDGSADLETLSVRSLQFQLPDVPSLPRSWYREHNPWGLDFFPEKVPGRLVSRFNDLHQGRPAALGMLHFGDAPDAGYTNQGRGQGESVWVNNEYDRPHMSLLFHGLTGQRHLLDSSLVCARHWLDVDFCHHHPDPLIDGGLKIHTAHHGTGGVIPSHEWTEGLLDYWCLTGRAEGLEAAESIGRNIMRHMELPRMRTPGAAAVREGGWALRAMIGLHLATGGETWRAEAERLTRMFLDWHDEFGALLAPYTSHTMPRVPFMISITVNSLARFRLIEANERVDRLIVSVVDDLVEHMLGPDGITFYKELPSLNRTAPTPHFLEALTHAFHVTGDRTYLKIAARQFAALTANPVNGRGGAKFVDSGGAVVAGTGEGRSFADSYSSVILFAAAAAREGLLDWYEYPYPDAVLSSSSRKRPG